ncbi:MAG: alpha/beta fold hydrolase [Leptolyngbya sp.]|nr:alpha/beta fold hydrolase [Leptolyngbya sp.]
MKPSSAIIPRTGRLKVPSGTLFWHEAGRGETLVFLHGSWQDSGQWLPVMEAMAADYHSLAPDLIGFGESASTAPVHSVALEVEALHTLLQALRISRCVLVGHSLGAWVALRYAQNYPQQVRGLVLVEPEGWANPQTAQRWRLDRWLVSPISPLITLAAWLGGKGRQRTWQRRRHLLRQSPAACQMLFRRRLADIVAEQVDPNQWPQTGPILQLMPNPPSPTEGSNLPQRPPDFTSLQTATIPAADTPLGLAEAATITAIQQFVATTLLTTSI